MKNIDPKSLIIGVLATALVFACTDSNKKNSASPSLVTEAKAATSKDDRGKWDNEQEWAYTTDSRLKKAGFWFYHEEEGFLKVTGGWQPYATGEFVHYFRKRLK